MNYIFLGDAELAAAFRLVGIDGRTVEDVDSARRVFAAITGYAAAASPSAAADYAGADGAEGGRSVRRGCHILILTEQVALWLTAELTEWQLSGCYPLVVEIPGLCGHLPNRKSLVDSIREAIGIHV